MLERGLQRARRELAAAPGADGSSSGGAKGLKRALWLAKYKMRIICMLQGLDGVPEDEAVRARGGREGRQPFAPLEAARHGAGDRHCQ